MGQMQIVILAKVMLTRVGYANCALLETQPVTIAVLELIVHQLMYVVVMIYVLTKGVMEQGVVMSL